MKRSLLAMLGMAAATACATTGAGSQSATPSERSSPSSGKPAFLLAHVEGKTGEELDDLFGEPALSRVEGQGEFRRYTLAECVLLIVLYPDDEGVKRAASIDAGAFRSGDEKPDLEQCLAGGLSSAKTS
jgi:hypothetical protein